MKKKQQKKSLGGLRFSSCPHHVAAAKEHAWSAVASSGGVMHVGRCRAHALEKKCHEIFFPREHDSRVHIMPSPCQGLKYRLSTNFTDTDDH